MHKRIVLISLLVISLFFCPISFAETIILKSGKTIEGKLIEKTDKYIKIDLEGVPLTYFLDEIESIDGQKLVLIVKETKADSTNSATSGSLKTEKANPRSMENLKTDQEVKPLRELPFSTAIITYKDSGEIYNGQEVVYIDVKKNIVSMDTHVEGKINGLTIKINKRDICDGKTLTNIDADKKTAPSFEVKEGDAISNLFYEKLWLKYYKDQKLFLGKECKVYQSPEGEAYFWNGILLRQETTKHPMGGRFNVTKEAVDIKLNVSIPDDRFEVPSGIKVMTPEETVGDMERMLEDLKDIKKEDLKRMKKDIEKIGGK